MSAKPHPYHPSELHEGLANWKELVKPYQAPDHRRAAWQVVNTIVPLAAAWAATYLSLQLSIWLAAACAVPTALLLSRLFILQHDCGHRSFVRGRRANDALGFAFSLITAVPFHYWAKTHRFHHKHNGSLEGRGIGDIPYLSVDEYARQPRWIRALYRIYRTPVFLFGIAPLIYLFICQRLPLTPLSRPMETIRKQLVNNASIALLYVLLGWLLGWREFFIVQGMVLGCFAVIAFWVFHVQHLHEHTLKQAPSEWTYLTSAMRGSSHYDLPPVLHWLTGNIGFHHIHHLTPAIPNYKLQQCFREQPMLTRYASSITLRESFAQVRNDLWDPEQQKMISFAAWEEKVAAETFAPVAVPGSSA
jgi:acyl-lipid omega-6 desaturase (Delta-12 desaturase)